MKRRILRMFLAVVVGLGVLAGVICVLIRTLGGQETLYQGKPLEYWVEQLNRGDEAARSRARDILVKEILPRLTEVMFQDTEDSNLRLTLIEKLNSLPGVNISFTAADGRRARAARSMGEFGSAAAPAIPALLQALKGKDDAVHGPAIAALGEIHAEPDVIIPLLISYLDNNILNSDAAEALGNFGSLAKPAVPKLTLLLKVPDKDLHHAVVGALRKIELEATGAAAK